MHALNSQLLLFHRSLVMHPVCLPGLSQNYHYCDSIAASSGGDGPSELSTHYSFTLAELKELEMQGITYQDADGEDVFKEVKILYCCNGKGEHALLGELCFLRQLRPPFFTSAIFGMQVGWVATPRTRVSDACAAFVTSTTHTRYALIIMSINNAPV